MRKLPALLLLAALLALAGCGYHLVGGGGKANRSVVSLVQFDDESREPLFGPTVVRELARRGVERMDLRFGDGGYNLTVRLWGLEETARAFSRSETPAEYLVVARADVTLSDGQKVIWKNMNLTVRREFTAGLDIASTRTNKNRALEYLADDLAGQILRRVAEAIKTNSARLASEGSAK